MSNHRMLSVAVAFILAGVVGCDAGKSELQDEEIITRPATERVEIQVPRQDTMLVEPGAEIYVDTVEAGSQDPFDSE